MDAVYFDNAATTFPKPHQVIKAVNDCLNHYAVNPRKGHNALVQQANSRVEQTRVSLANLLLTRPEQLMFVPSATFGINLVMRGLPLKRGDYIYISPFEHNAVVRCAEHLKLSRGVEWRQLPVDLELRVDVEEMRRAFEYNPPNLVVVTHASNVTGDLLPIKTIIDASHRYGAKVLVDAAQTIGCYTPTLEEYNYDYLSFSSHKGLYGIPGAGGIVIKHPEHELTPMLYGGTGVNSEAFEMPTTCPERFETGTAPLPSIISMHAGLEWLIATGIERIKEKQASLRNTLVQGLSNVHGVSILGADSARNIGTVALTMDFFTVQELNMILDSHGICVRSGLHCAPLAHRSLGTFPNGAIRVSPSWFNDTEEVMRLINLLVSL